MVVSVRLLSCVSCRARLSYEQFSQFLVAIKELNAGRTSREDTLGAAKALFGPNNSDLYGEGPGQPPAAVSVLALQLGGQPQANLRHLHYANAVCCTRALRGMCKASLLLLHGRLLT
jgi:hypothetical protein